MLIQGFGCKTQTMWWITDNTKHGSKIKKLKWKKASKQMSDVHCEIKITITIKNQGLWTQRAFGQLLRATRRWDQEIKATAESQRNHVHNTAHDWRAGSRRFYTKPAEGCATQIHQVTCRFLPQETRLRRSRLFLSLLSLVRSYIIWV